MVVEKEAENLATTDKVKTNIYKFKRINVALERKKECPKAITKEC